MAITAEKALQNNQSILQNFGLGEELDEQSAEIISGGVRERFTIMNSTNDWIYYTLDGKRARLKPHGDTTWTTGKGGRIRFDYDTAKPGIQPKSYNLSNGKIYEFKPNRRTPYRYDIDLYRVGR